MEIDLADIAAEFRTARADRQSRHDVPDRLKPGLFQYDYLALSTLAADVARLINSLPAAATKPLALDIGCNKSPYRSLVEAQGFALKTLDIDAATAPDIVGSVEATGLPDASADLVLCTQVLEHCLDPAQGVREIFRILRPGGHLIASAPHVWFYHPHPSDNWRFTQEGLTRLVASAGFEPVRLLAQGSSALGLFQVVNFLLYGLLGRGGAPLYAVGNLAGLAADRLVRNTLFSLNFAVLARKPAVV